MACAEPPLSGAQWLEKDYIMYPYQLKQKRIQDPVEQLLALQFYVDDNIGSVNTDK